jgi:hypothetical protein
MTCNKDAKMTVVVGSGPGRVKYNLLADKIAQEHKCGESSGRFGFVCSLECAAENGWLW